MILEEDKKTLSSVWMHFDTKLFIANNFEGEIADIEPSDTYKEWCKYSIGNDFFKPCATNLKIKNEPMPWEGEPDKKPEIERCYSLNIKEKLESGVVDMGHEWFCIFTNAD